MHLTETKDLPLITTLMPVDFFLRAYFYGFFLISLNLVCFKDVFSVGVVNKIKIHVSF